MATRIVGTGGADRGVCSAGAFAALYQEKIGINSIFATSVDVLNALAYLLEIVEEMESVWKKEIKVKEKLRNLDMKGLAKGFIKYSPSLFKGDFIKELIGRYVTPENYNKLLNSAIDFEFPVLNLNTGKIEFVSNRIEIPFPRFKKMALAAISVPGLFPSVEIDGAWYADAGIIDNIGLIHALRNASPKDIVIVFHNFPEKAIHFPINFKSWLTTLWRSTELRQTFTAEKDAAFYKAILDTRSRILEKVGKITSGRFSFRKRNLQKNIMEEINRAFSSLITPSGNLPVVAKKIDIFPPPTLAIFKTATPPQKDLKDAFEKMFEVASEILRKEFPRK